MARNRFATCQKQNNIAEDRARDYCHQAMEEVNKKKRKL